MKLRLHANSIRLRLSQSDVLSLNEQGVAESAIDFGLAGGKFVYRLVADENTASPAAEFFGNELVVRIPREKAIAWTNSDVVGLRGDQAADAGTVLRILVEKDFACVKPRPGEDDLDTFPNPARAGLS